MESESEAAPLLQKAIRHYRGTFTEREELRLPREGKSMKNVFNSDGNRNSPLLEELSKRKESEVKKKGCSRFIGIFMTLTAAIFFSFTTLFAKLLLGYHPFNVAVFRFYGILIPSIPVLVWSCWKGEPVFQAILPVYQMSKLKTSAFLFLRAFFGCTAVILQFYALQYIAIGDTIVISFTTPVFVMLLSRVFLGETCGSVPILTALFTLIGIGVMSRPPILTGAAEFDVNNLIGVSLALGCMLCATFTYVILRWLRNVHFGLVTFFYGFYSVIECTIGAIIINSLSTPVGVYDWLLAIALAVLAFGGQTFFTLALKFEEAGPVSLIRTSEVVFTFVLQIIILGEFPDMFSIVGAFTVLAAVFVTAFRKWLAELPTDHPSRQKYWIFLK